jgi:hypothetical protein
MEYEKTGDRRQETGDEMVEWWNGGLSAFHSSIIPLVCFFVDNQ